MPALSNSEIGAIEAVLGVALPVLYRRLLVEIGPGAVGNGCEIYRPDSVRELYEPFFDHPDQLFSPYFPFGCDNRKQEVWVINADEERAASIWHETVPDDWPDEEWLPYEVWVDRHLEPESDDNDGRSTAT